MAAHLHLHLSCACGCAGAWKAAQEAAQTWQAGAIAGSHLRVGGAAGCVALDLCPVHLAALQACWHPFALWQASPNS